jgi:PST family polysaccharide transporter
MWISAPIFGFLFVAALPVIVLTLGNRWRESAAVFQILAIFALGQLLSDSTVWLLVSRGQSQRLLNLSLIISPIIVGSYAIGLPFGIRGVALSGALVLLAIFPWMLNFSFRGTNLTLKRLGSAIVYPISVCLAGVLSAELATRLIAYHTIFSQLVVTTVGFGIGCLLTALVPAIRQELISLKTLFDKSLPMASPQTVISLD